MKTLDCWGAGTLDPMGSIGRIYVGTTRHCYIPNIYAMGLMLLEGSYKFFPVISLWELYIAMATRVPIQKHHAAFPTA